MPTFGQGMFGIVLTLVILFVVTAVLGLGESQVQIAKADAAEKQGGIEAEVACLKATAEAEGINKKAEAMKLFNEAGRPAWRRRTLRPSGQKCWQSAQGDHKEVKLMC